MNRQSEPEQTTDLDREEASATTTPGVAQTRLTVRDIMNPDVVTATPAEEVFSAVQRMCYYRVSCVVVLDGDDIVGLLTQKDLLLATAREQEGYGQQPVAQHMSSPVRVASPAMPVHEAGLILESRRIKHLPVAAQRKLVGIVTQTDITRGLIYLTPLQRVSEVMSPHVTTVGEETTVAAAARIMSSQNISCVVVTRFDEPLGILTQRDILIRVILTQRNPTCTPVAEVMSSPLLPIPLDYSVFAAGRAMDKMRIHRLVVTDARRVCGIVSQTDILRALERRLAEEEQARLLPAHSSVPMFLLDATGVVTCANAAFRQLFGTPAYPEMVGSVLVNEAFWSDPEDRERLLTALEKGRSDRLELVARSGAGGRRRILMLLAVTRNIGGEIAYWQGVAWPLTGCRMRGKALGGNAPRKWRGQGGAGGRIL